jgi:hypothetical protein
MTIPQRGYSRLARRPRSGAARLLAHALASLLLAAHGARAQDARPVAASRATAPVEVWVCSDHKASAHDRRPPLEFARQDGLLIERPLGTQRYRMLTDNEHAIIAIDDYAGFEPVLGTVNVFVSTMMIDKATGNFAQSTIVSDRVLEPRTGRCRKFEEQAASGKIVAQRK